MALPRLERVNALWFLTLGVTALAAAILVYILLLESALGAFSIKDASPGAIGSQTRPSVALLNSDYTKQVHRNLNLRDTSTTWVDQTLLSWREFLIEKGRKIPFKDINDRDLERGDVGDYDVLILPSARALSDLQIRRIKEFMERGGSVLATWTPGVYREDGSWRGWDFVQDVFGVQFEGFVERGLGNYRIYTDTFPGVTPVGTYLPIDRSANGRGLAGGSTDGDWTGALRTGDARVDGPLSVELGSGMRALRRQEMRREAAAADFPPLRNYVWEDTLLANAPLRDFARARPITAPLRDVDGNLRMQDAVVVSYYTWIGGDPETQIPFPRTSAGIRRFTLRGDSPLSAGIPGGYRVKIQVYNPGVKVRIAEPERSESGGFWYDFAVDELVGADAAENTSGVAYGTYGKGRFVYLGFQRNAMGVGPNDREDWVRLGQFFANVMNYLRRKPVIWVHDWPYPYRAAGMMTGVGESNVSNFSGVVDMLNQERFPGTFMVKPERVGAYGALMKRLHDNGDVGVYDTLLRRDDGSVATQRERLRRQRMILENLVEGPVRGYRSTKRGMLSDYTMSGLVEADTFTYFMPDSIGRRTTPKIMGFPFETLTRIGVSTRGDKDLLSGGPNISMDLAGSLIQSGIRRVAYERSLYNLIYSSDLLGSPENVGILRDVARTLKRGRDFWIASGDSVALWWRLHQGLNADVEQRGPSRIFVRVSNDNGHIAKEAAVSISLGRSVTAVNIRPELINIFKPIPDDIDIPPYELRENGTVLVLPIRELKPQQYRIFHIDLLGPGSTSGTND